MIPCKQRANIKHTILKAFYNKHLLRRRNVVENIVILKKTFKNLMFKSILHILFLCDVVTCCCLVFNMIMDGKDVDVLMFQLEQKDAHGGIRMSRNNRMDVKFNEVEATLQGNELLGSSQILILVTYLGNKQAHKE
jgi:hypothetical protein